MLTPKGLEIWKSSINVCFSIPCLPVKIPYQSEVSTDINISCYRLTACAHMVYTQRVIINVHDLMGQLTILLYTCVECCRVLRMDNYCYRKTPDHDESHVDVSFVQCTTRPTAPWNENGPYHEKKKVTSKLLSFMWCTIFRRRLNRIIIVLFRCAQINKCSVPENSRIQVQIILKCTSVTCG
jgi:hypothetical protein